MITHTHKFMVNVGLIKAARWFKNDFAASFIAIYPEERLAFRAYSKPPFTKGSVFFVKEKIGNFLLNSKIIITGLDDRYFSFRCLFLYPLINSGGEFRLDPIGQNKTAATSILFYGTRIPILSYILDRIMPCIIPRSAMLGHMKKQDIGIKREIERGDR